MWGIVRGLIVCLLLSGCAVREANLKMFDNQRPASGAERSAIVANIKTTFFDPYSIRDAQISNAVEGTGIDSSKTRMICVYANAKNRMGAYTGVSGTLYYFTGDGNISRSVNSSDDAFVAPFCKDSRLGYGPLTEVEQKS